MDQVDPAATSGPRPSVVFVASHLQPVLGLERTLLDLAGALDPEFDVQIVCFGGSPSDHGLGVRVKVLGPARTGMRRLLAGRAVRRAVRAARDADSIVVVGIWAAIPFLLMAPRSVVRRSVLWEHSAARENRRANPRLRILTALAAVLYRRVDTIVCVSGPLRQDLAKVVRGPRMDVIPNLPPEIPAGVVESSRSQGRSATPMSEVVLAAVGSLSPTKNQATVLRALALLPGSVRLAVVGDGKDRAMLGQLVDELDLRDRVRFHGYLERSEALGVMARADVFVHAATGETFGLVYHEAAALGVPVVAVRNPVASTLIPSFVPGGLAENDPRSLADAVLRALAEPTGEATKTIAAARRAEAFAATVVLDGWVRVLRAEPTKWAARA